MHLEIENEIGDKIIEYLAIYVLVNMCTTNVHAVQTNKKFKLLELMIDARTPH